MIHPKMDVGTSNSSYTFHAGWHCNERVADTIFFPLEKVIVASSGQYFVNRLVLVN